MSDIDHPLLSKTLKDDQRCISNHGRIFCDGAARNRRLKALSDTNESLVGKTFVVFCNMVEVVGRADLYESTECGNQNLFACPSNHAPTIADTSDDKCGKLQYGGRQRCAARGRSARRRRAKMRSIAQAEHQLLFSTERGANNKLVDNAAGRNSSSIKHVCVCRTNNVEQVDTNVSRSAALPGLPTTIDTKNQEPLYDAVPTDRGLVLPGVLEQRRKNGTVQTFDTAFLNFGGNQGSDDFISDVERIPSREVEGGSDATINHASAKYSNTSDGLELIRQLGFIPGNAIAVSSRRDTHVLANVFTAAAGVVGGNVKCQKNTVDKPTQLGIPIVLKLYPLAVRNEYGGGKTNGRKFKSRRRGNVGTKVRQSHNSKVQDCIVESTAIDEVSSSSKSLLPFEGTNDKGREGQARINEENSDRKIAGRRDWKAPGDLGGIIEPFPTIYWLTCPTLRSMISRLENGSTLHNIKSIEERLQSDPVALNSMKVAHARYGKERWSLLTDFDRTEVTHRGWATSLDDTSCGVAGLRRFDRVKCLHTHAAHYLSGEETNIIGRWVMEAVEDQFWYLDTS